MTLLVALSALLIVGGYGIWELGRSQTSHEAMMDNIFPSIDDITKAQHGLTNIRVGIRDITLAANETELADAKAKIELGKSKIDSALDDYQQKNIYNEEDQQALNKVKDSYNQFWQVIQPLVQHASSMSHEQQIAQLKNATKAARATEAAMDAHYTLNKVLTKQDAAESRKAYETSRLISLAVIALAFLVSGLLAVSLYRAIRTGLGQIRQALHQISDTLDFSQRVAIVHQDEVGDACQALNRLLDTLQTSFKSLRHVADDVGKASLELSATAQQVSTASAAQSEAASSMAATIEQMTVSINHVAEQAVTTKAGTEEARELVQSGSAIIRQTILDIHEISSMVKSSATDIQKLEQESAQVGTVVNVIRDIADQTNLLALNAAIEAARAGEQGRGFAVVADEVRKLAERTTKSTQEIAATIESMVTMAKRTAESMEAADTLVETSVSRADEASRAIETIGEHAAHSASSIGEISAAIQQQGVASNNIAMQVERTAQMSEESSAAAQNTAASAHHLDALVQQQLQTLSNFKL
ncbi:methyl-accepting chemotaxis protein [Paludibacterium sp. THUN1379]|nr:methyl-accepting chemotaxis protein [Paludibacterium sp. THUN1379]